MGIVQVTQEQFQELLRSIEAEKQARAVEMPTEHEALQVMQKAYKRLEELGWRSASYCPKDGTVFDSIECGSTVIHDCHYTGQWPRGGWWVHEAEDLWPSRPTLFRLKAPTTNPHEARHDADR